MAQAHGGYYVPAETRWPIVGSVALTLMVLGGVNWLHEHEVGKLVLLGGLLLLLVMVFGWFGNVIRESQAGLNNEQMDRSYRWGMAWFIVSGCFSSPPFSARCSLPVSSRFRGWAVKATS